MCFFASNMRLRGLCRNGELQKSTGIDGARFAVRGVDGRGEPRCGWRFGLRCLSFLKKMQGRRNGVWKLLHNHPFLPVMRKIGYFRKRNSIDHTFGVLANSGSGTPGMRFSRRDGVASGPFAPGFRISGKRSTPRGEARVAGRGFGCCAIMKIGRSRGMFIASIVRPPWSRSSAGVDPAPYPQAIRARRRFQVFPRRAG